MAQNIKTIVELNPHVNCYMPIIEAVVNAIESIELSKRKDGKIEINIIRGSKKLTDIFNKQQQKDTSIKGFEIIDNGIGFTNDTTDSYDEPFTDAKFTSHKCKGYGRFTALKIFNKVNIDSIYKEIDGKYYERTFGINLLNIRAEGRDIIAFENKKEITGNDNITKVVLIDIKKDKNKFDINGDTISKRVFEYLLPYFLNTPYINFPSIIINDEAQSFDLNKFIKKTTHIIKHSENVFQLESNGNLHNFKVDFILMHGSHSDSSNIILTASNREVTASSLSSYIPEFSPGLKDIDKNHIDNLYYIKAFVSSSFLDENVNFQREKFNFPDKNIKEDLLNNISKHTIEKKIAEIAREHFEEIFKKRVKIKQDHIIKLVQTELPYYQRLLKKISTDDIPYDINSKKLSQILNEKQFQLEEDLKHEISELKFDHIDDKNEYEELCSKLNDIQKDQLTHYMLFRKLIIDNLGKLLEYSYKDKKFQVEDKLHDLIFPTNRETDNTDYDDHNLRILDEKLTFNKYVTSDIRIFDNSGERIDLAIFNNITFTRDSNENDTPCIIYEFKRPGDKLEKKDHVAKLMDYLNNVRNNKIKEDYKKRKLKVCPTTPLFGYLIADLNNDIIKQLDRYGFIKTPDGDGYYLRHNSSKAYIEFITWDKLKSDVEKRHKIFFHKLGIQH